jgi:hypothetical protein
MKRKRRGIDGRRAGGVSRSEEVGRVWMASSSWPWLAGLGRWPFEREIAGLGAGGEAPAWVEAEAERRRCGVEAKAERRGRGRNSWAEAERSRRRQGASVAGEGDWS